MVSTDTEGSTTAERIAAAALRLAGRIGWRNLALAEVAEEAGVSLAELARHYSCRPEILDGFERMIDRKMLAGVAAGDVGDAPRDRLFDVIMERFDALQPYRDGVCRISRELPLDPPSGLVLACGLPRSVAWMYVGARVSIEGPLMPVRIAVLSGAYLGALRVWLTDEADDMAQTMAALDRQLDRAKRLLGGDFGPTRPAEPPAPPEPSITPSAGPAPKTTTRAAPRRNAPRKKASE